MLRKMALAGILLLATTTLGLSAPPVAKITGTSVVVIDITESQGDAVRLVSVPAEALNHCSGRTLDGRSVLEFYWPGHPRVTFLVFASVGAQDTVARYVVPADGEPAPDPTPDPLPPGEKRVVIVHETLNPEYPHTKLIAQLALSFQQKGQDYRLFDPQQTEAGKTPAWAQAVLDVATKLDQPLLAVVTRNEKGYSVVGVSSFPTTLEQAETFLKEKGVQ